MKLLLHTLLMFMLLFYSQLTSAQLADGQDKFLGNIHTGGQTPLNFDFYWNQVTPGNAGKWASCEQARDDFSYWLWLDRAYNHAKQNNYVFKEHTLVWGASSGEPTWMSSVPEDEQKDEVIEWYEAVAERYPDIDLIDVVNEPLHDAPSYTDALGGDGDTGWDWVIWCFEEAREVFPDAKLLLNEYNVLNYTSTCEDFIEIVKILQERDLIDGVGLQAHSLESIGISTIKANLDSVAATGIDIYISEYEARGDDSTQLALFKEQFPVFWEHPSVKGVTLWGYLEGDMWRETAYLLEDDGVTERPALEWLREYFNYYPDSVQYSFETNIDGNGSITLDPEGGVYDSFTDVTATAVADSGYEFSYWTGDVGGSTNPTTLSMISNRSLTAHFVEIEDEDDVDSVYYTLSVTTEGNGSVDVSPSADSYLDGTSVMLTASADSGYVFDSWSGDASDTAESITITMDANKSITANFIESEEEDTTSTSDCDFDTPLSTALPSVCTSYSYVYVLGNDGPDLSNVSNFTINWDLINSGLWQLSLNTNDGNPNWWNNLLDCQTNTFSSIEPTITLSNTGFDGLDGTYYVTIDDDNFVMVDTAGLFTIYCSNSSDTPECFSLKNECSVLSTISSNDVNIYPNPVEDRLTINLESTEVIRDIIIYNSLGKIVKSQTDLNAEKDYSISLDMPSGIYLLKIETNQAIYTKQFVKK